MTATARLQRGGPTLGAIRSRRYRRRQANDEEVCPVPVRRRVLEALLDRGLAEVDSRNRTKVAEELGVVLDQWAERWFAEKNRDA
jgi:hypothetical protein